MSKQILKEVIGLSELEVQAYFMLLNLGPQPASVIASKVNTPRPSIYPVLERLLKKGVVTYCLRHKVRYFSSISLDKLEMKLQEKERMYNSKADLIKQNRGKLRDYFQIYKSDQPTLQGKSRVQSFIGFEGVKTLWQTLLSQSGNIELYGWPAMNEATDELWVEQIHKALRKKSCKLLLPIRHKKKKLSKKFNRSKRLKYKFINENSDEEIGECMTCSAGSMSAYIAYQDDLVYGVLAEDERLTSQLNRLFKLLWKI